MAAITIDKTSIHLAGHTMSQYVCYEIRYHDRRTVPFVVVSSHCCGRRPPSLPLRRKLARGRQGLAQVPGVRLAPRVPCVWGTRGHCPPAAARVGRDGQR